MYVHASQKLGTHSAEPNKKVVCSKFMPGIELSLKIGKKHPSAIANELADKYRNDVCLTHCPCPHPTVAFLLTGTFLFTLCKKLQLGMAQGRPWGYLWAYRSPNSWPSGGFHLLPWTGQRTFPPAARARRFGGNAAALIWALHPWA